MPTITTGKYLKRDELSEEGDPYTVESVEEQEVSLNDGGTEKKWVMQLSDLKPLILNATNIRRAVAAFGSSETEDWIGKRIIAYDDPEIEFGGKIVGGVRLRAVPARGAKAPKKSPPEDSIPF